jgi:hypothetical protein
MKDTMMAGSRVLRRRIEGDEDCKLMAVESWQRKSKVKSQRSWVRSGGHTAGPRDLGGIKRWPSQ